MNEDKPRITKDIITRYYVEIGDWIQAGPFDTREEAQAALKQSKKRIAQEVTISEPSKTPTR